VHGYPGPGDRNPLSRSFAFCHHGQQSLLEKWQARCVEHLLASGDACLVLRIVLRDHEGSSTALERIAGRGRSHLLFRWYRKHCLRPAATRPAPPAGVIAQIRLLICSAFGRDESGCHLCDTDLRTIEQVDLDFILYYGESD
jgi:hypothetical protein